jgi:prepilin-type N-terminal cleavage/methylation domain-containing protein
MTSRKGFTLIELMVVIFIVGILAAVAIPIMRGRIDAAKWSEGKASAGSVRTAIRAYLAEKGSAYATYGADLDGDITVFGPSLGFAPGDLEGKYFADGDYTISDAALNAAGGLDYLITIGVSKAEAPAHPSEVTLDQDGLLTEIP